MIRSKAVAVAALLAGAGFLLLVTFVMSYGLIVEYGPTTGSAWDGALQGFAWGGAFGVSAALLAVGAAYVAGWHRVVLGLAGVAVAAGVVGPFVGGAFAAMEKYDDLADSPRCVVGGMGSGPAAAAAQAAENSFAELDHPSKVGGGGSSGVDGCDRPLLDISIEEAAGWYPAELERHGWTVDDAGDRRVTATRDGQVFRLTEVDGSPMIHIGPQRS
ncbi:MAG TPA: hypothetical protein VFK41_12370 [Nocardioidaceae bacterium]|nr:hypothetical protein [Nocardioidaceae bacterium]